MLKLSQNSCGFGNCAARGGPEATASGFRRNKRGCSEAGNHPLSLRDLDAWEAVSKLMEQTES
jgi:hypothetical protein